MLSKNAKGKLVLVSAPSGGGKNAVIRALLQHYPNATQLVTTTTRAMRPGEIEGSDYYFLSRDEFEKKLKAGDFVEYNEYADNLYGTQWHHLNKALEEHDFVFSQADVYGKQHLDELNIPHVSIFLQPENLEILKKRIENRGGTTDEAIEKRLDIANDEIQRAQQYDVCIENKEGRFNETVEQVIAFLEK